MGKIVKKYIGSAQVGSVQIRLENDLSLAARNAANSADVSLLKLDSGDLLQMLQHPYLPGDATANLQAATKQQVLLLDGSQAMTAALNMNSNLINSVSDPVSAQDAATKNYVDLADANKADTNLDNLVNTAIPTGVSFNSASIIQVNDATQFELRTIDQTTTDSGNVRIRSGDVGAGDFDSGAVRMVSGASTNPTKATAATVATGLITVASGAIAANAGSTVGSTGNVNILGGSISGTGSHSGNTGLLQVSSGSISNASVTGNTGDSVFLTGSNAGTGNSGLVAIRSGEVSGTGTSGAHYFFTGRSASGTSGEIVHETGAISSVGPGYPGGLTNGSNAAGSTGNIAIRTGLIGNASNTGNTGTLNISTGSHAGTASGNSGDINVTTGTVVGGTRGKVAISSRIVEINSQLDMQANKIVDLLDPTAAQDAATKAYVDAQVSAGVSSDFEKITLSAGDITNQYVDLADKYVIGSLDVSSSRVVLNVSDAVDADYDFQGDNSGAVTRLLFQGPSATAGAEALVAGDILFIKGILA